MREFYQDLRAAVRHDGFYHSIKGLVQPDDPRVKKVALVLVQAPDFIEAVQAFVASFTTYKRQVGDYWKTPSETLADEAGDCDDKAILTCSLLRNYIPPDEVYCAFGNWKGGGHMWVLTVAENGEDIIIEATAPPSKPIKGKYILKAMFNDKYCFATQDGIKDFDLLPAGLRGVLVARR